MDSEIDASRKLLNDQTRAGRMAERRERLDEIGSVQPADLDGASCGWSLAPGSNPTRLLLFFHGGGYCSGSIRSRP